MINVKLPLYPFNFPKLGFDLSYCEFWVSGIFPSELKFHHPVKELLITFVNFLSFPCIQETHLLKFQLWETEEQEREQA